MRQLRYVAGYLALVLLLGLLLWAALPGLWAEQLAVAQGGQPEADHLRVAVTGGSELWVAGVQGGDWRLLMGSAQGRRRSVRLEKLGLDGVLGLGPMHGCADGGLLLSAYEQQEQLWCRLYYISPDGRQARQLLSLPCTGNSTEDVRLFGYTEEGGAVAFLVEGGPEGGLYHWNTAEEAPVRLLEPEEMGGQLLLAGSDGAPVALREGRQLTTGSDSVRLPEGLEPVAGWESREGLWLLDGTAGGLWRLRPDSGRLEQPYSLPDPGNVVDVSISRSGQMALLGDDGSLMLLLDGELTDACGLLCPPRWQSVVLLALSGLGVLLAALVLLYGLLELRKLRLSLVLRYGVGAAAVLAILTVAAIRGVIRPHYQQQAEQAAERYLRTAALAAPEPVSDPLGADWDFDRTLTTRAEYVYALWRAFGSPQVELGDAFDDVPDDSPYRMAVAWALHYNITDGIGEGRFGPDLELSGEQGFTFLYRAMRYIGGTRMSLRWERGSLYRVDNDGGRSLLSAQLLGGRFRAAAEQALEQGSAFVRYTADGAVRYGVLVRSDTRTLSVLSAHSGAYLPAAEQGAQATARLLWGAAATALGLVLLVLAALSRNLRRVADGMAAIQRGSYVEVVDQTGDEVSAMAASLNGMASAMREEDERQLRERNVYARFMPERIAELLGVESVDSIDKQTHSARVMTTMHVSFHFDERVYENRSGQLFHNINEVTGRTARIVSEGGGAILSFSHNGFDALFPPDSGEAVRAAVAIRQQVIAINRERTRQEQPQVTLRITLDSGQVLLGVVGDESRMQATAVSASFNTARMLEALFGRFEAHILCTERIERWAGAYSSRYIGKTHDGDELIRVYEIYDGDPYLIRQGKGESAEAFARGVYTLYAGEFTEAKRMFMELVRRNSGDGAARYYLYLADRFEKEPPAVVALDV